MSQPAPASGKQRPAHLFKPGQSGNPAGRARGSRNRLADAFVTDLRDLWAEQGRDVLERVARDDPGTLLKVVASLMPKDIAVNVTNTVVVGDFPDRFRAALDALHEQRTIEHQP